MREGLHGHRKRQNENALGWEKTDQPQNLHLSQKGPVKSGSENIRFPSSVISNVYPLVPVLKAVRVADPGLSSSSRPPSRVSPSSLEERESSLSSMPPCFTSTRLPESKRRMKNRDTKCLTGEGAISGQDRSPSREALSGSGFRRTRRGRRSPW